MTEQQKVIWLLQPRYEVINPWPGNSAVKKGHIYTAIRNETNYYNCAETNDMVFHPELYPANLRCLHWSEWRTLDDMPNYLKTHGGNSVRKVANYDFSWNRIYVTFEGGRKRGLEKDKWIPATKAEYEQYIQSKKP